MYPALGCSTVLYSDSSLFGLSETALRAERGRGASASNVSKAGSACLGDIAT